ncbi:twinfilin [Phlebotomus argentipes]|uniref:twinfilin n=1 Tax=Phlebotomus argentipes TaxID=94469 RepID=UPI002892D3D8|nr:twinfilin [Phlebotomus argentipes]
MSHQTGIKANEKLLKFFGKCRDGKTRAVKITIENEELTLSDQKEAKKDWIRDYDSCVPAMIEADTPCYVLYRLDTKSSLGGFEWLLLSWSPDTATIRHKMVYASTKATLKSEFGSAHIKEEFHATAPEEATFAGYERHKREFSAPAPLTTREEELQELRRTEVKTDIGNETRQQTLNGINFPVSQAALDAIRDAKRGAYTYLQFRLDTAQEEIHLVKAASVDAAALAQMIPKDEARYHLFLYKHTHEGDYLESFVFIYSMPGYACSVKDRMMYSSCKAPFVATIAGQGVEVAKKLEVDATDDVTEEFLRDELHPKKILHRPIFDKPPGPKNRGAKRVTRPQTTE